MGYSSHKLSAELKSFEGVEFQVGDSYKCPEDHVAKIVWVSEDKETIAVRCPYEHFSKVVKVTDYDAPPISFMRYRTKEKEIFAKNMVFMMKI
jgi:hypothetical protein